MMMSIITIRKQAPRARGGVTSASRIVVSGLNAGMCLDIIGLATVLDGHATFQKHSRNNAKRAVFVTRNPTKTPSLDTPTWKSVKFPEISHY